MRNVVNVLFICTLAGYAFLFSGALHAQVPIAWGESIVLAIDPASEIETFTTPVFQSGDIIFLRVSPVSSLVKPRIRLINQSGTVVATAQTSSSFTVVELLWTVPAGGGGSYTIAVSDLDARNTGQFCASLHRFNNPPAAVLMACNSSQNSSLGCRSSIKAFKYTVLANTLAEIVVTPTSSLVKPKVWVCDEGGNIMAKDSTLKAFTAVSIIVPTQAQTQCFYILVADVDGSNNGNFSISQGVLAGDCPTATIQSTAASGVVCAGEALTLSAETNTNKPIFKWTGPNGFTSSQPSISFDNVTTAQSGTYTLTVTDESDCILITSGKTIKVVDLTAAVIPTPANGNVCAGTGFSLRVSTNAVKPTYSWSGPGGFVTTQPTVAFSNATTAQSGLYSVTVTDENGCTETATRSINVISFNASLQSDPADGNVCAGNSFTLNVATNAANPTYRITGPQGFSSTQARATFTNASTLQTGTYNVTVTDQNGCTKTASTTVKVIDFNVSLTSDPVNGVVCEGNRLKLDVSTTAENPTFRFVGPADFNSSQPTVTFNNTTLPRNGRYSVTVTDINGCAKLAEKQIIVNPLPAAVIITDPAEATVCSGDAVTLEVSTNIPSASYTWRNPGGGIFSQQKKVTVTPSQSGNYSVEVRNTTTGCSRRESQLITVNPVPLLLVEVSHDTIIASVMGGTEPYTFEISGDSFGEGKPFQGKIGGVPDGEYTITVTDVNGCMAKADDVVISPVTVIPSDEWGLSVAPNPSAGLSTIILKKAPRRPLRCWLFDNTGKLIRTAELNSTVTILDLTTLPRGLYFLRISDGEKIGTEKVARTN